MAFETLLFDVDDDGHALVTINRPDKLNALNRQVIDELESAVSAIRDRDDIRGGIITGAGDRSFVAGADISQFLELSPEDGRRFAERGQSVFSLIETSSKPIIAAVNGFALGGGCELALACHLRTAATSAVFGQPEVGLGIIPGYGGTQRLPRLVGFGIASEMILTGEPIDAQRAYYIGLVNRVIEPDVLIPETRKLLGIITSKAPRAVAWSLEAMRKAITNPAGGMDAEARLFGQACGTSDFKEGARAFLDRRKPNFTGQ